MIKAILFDLDGTLLPMNDEEFISTYFKLLCNKFSNSGYEPNKLKQTILNGTYIMMQNNGSKTNEQAFWDYFVNIYGEEKLTDKLLFDNFYLNEFKQVKNICKENNKAKNLINFCKENFEYVILATSPVFPKSAVLTRMNFINLTEKDFDLITTYEDFHYAKPNPNYFLEILNKFNLKPDEAIMFGNSELEDFYGATKAGIKTYIVGDNIVKDNKNTYSYTHIKFDEIKDILIKEKRTFKK